MIFGLFCKITGLITDCLVTYPAAFFRCMLRTWVYVPHLVASVFVHDHDRKKSGLKLVLRKSNCHEHTSKGHHTPGSKGTGILANQTPILVNGSHDSEH